MTGKEENTVYQHFLLIPHVVKRLLSQGRENRELNRFFATIQLIL